MTLTKKMILYVIAIAACILLQYFDQSVGLKSADDGVKHHYLND